MWYEHIAFKASYIYDIIIFTDIRGKKISIKNSCIFTKKDVPPRFTQSSGSNFLIFSFDISCWIQEGLSFLRFVFSDLAEKYLDCCVMTLTIADSKFFIEKILDMRTVSIDLILMLKSKVQIKIENDGKNPEGSFFEATSKTEVFVYHEHDVFEDEVYKIPASGLV